MNIHIFSTINTNDVDEFKEYLIPSHWDKINFKLFTKYHNKNLVNYEFDSTSQDF